MDLSATIHRLGESLGLVLRTQESVALFETEEQIRALAKARRAGEMDAAVRLPARRPQPDMVPDIDQDVTQAQLVGGRRQVETGLVPQPLED